MNRLVAALAFGTMFGGAFMLAGCGPGGITFNGVQQVEQFPIRKTPISHYNLPSEMINPITQVASVVEARLPVQASAFIQRGPAGYDLWCQMMYPHCTDAPTCPAGDQDWRYANDSVSNAGAAPGGPRWKGHATISAYVLSFQNQWFLRGVDGNDLVPAVVGQPPVTYENIGFQSMKISIHERARATSPFSPLIGAANPAFAQQEVGDPATLGANGVARVRVPCQNVVMWQWADAGSPAGLVAAAWQEPPAENISIETNMALMDGVPAPAYFAGNGPITTKLGVFLKAYVSQWTTATGNQGSLLLSDDNVAYAYYLAAIGTHVIGYGVGLVDSGFAVPGVADNDQEDLMNVSVVFDMSAFIAGGQQFQFVTEDLIRMQDVVRGSWQTPGPLSTLPGVGR